MSAHPASGEAERVVKLLTAAQALALLSSPSDSERFRPAVRVHVMVTMKLRTKGLIVWTPSGYRFTPLGLAVRSLLQERNQ